MNPLSPFFLVLGSGGLCFLVAGIVMQKKPPPHINNTYGYRTSRSMQSQDAWEFAQAYSASKMIRYSVATISASIAGLFLFWHPLVETAIGIVLLCVPVVLMWLQTERELAERFERAEPAGSERVESL